MRNKIIAYIPVWGRPEILLEHLLYTNDWYTPFYILSLKDPKYYENMSLISMFGHNYTIHENDFLGAKENFGIKMIESQYPDYEYLIHIGSDDLINPELLHYYIPEIVKETPFFGVSGCHFHEKVGKKRCVYLPKYNDEHCIGAGRMIHRSVIEAMNEANEPIYTPSQQSGLDNNSRLNIKRVLGIDDKVIKTGKSAYVLDLKTNTNINPLTMMEALSDRFVDVQPEWLYQFFEKRIPSKISKLLYTSKGFLECHRLLNNTFKDDRRCFEFINSMHRDIFGADKYTSFKAFRVVRNRS